MRANKFNVVLIIPGILLVSGAAEIVPDDNAIWIALRVLVGLGLIIYGLLHAFLLCRSNRASRQYEVNGFQDSG